MGQGVFALKQSNLNYFSTALTPITLETALFVFAHCTGLWLRTTGLSALLEFVHLGLTIKLCHACFLSLVEKIQKYWKVVRVVGLEPTSHERRILSPLGLPISPYPHYWWTQ